MGFFDMFRRKRPRTNSEIVVTEKNGLKLAKFPGVRDYYIQFPEPEPGKRGYWVREYSVKELKSRGVAGGVNLNPVIDTWGVSGDYKGESSVERVFVAEEVGRSQSQNVDDYYADRNRMAHALSEATGSDVSPKTIKIVRTQQIQLTSNGKLVKPCPHCNTMLGELYQRCPSCGEELGWDK